MCVGCEPRTQRQGEFKRGLSCQQWNVLQHEATGVRGGMILQNATVKVLLFDAMQIMVQPMNPAVRGCAERARRSR
jgi:hypothetical protein